jgi:hypothetical protein
MAERRTVRTYSPEYGTLRTLLLVGAIATVAAGAAPTVAAAVGFASLEYALYGVAAVLAIAALLYEGRRQRANNPHEFVARNVLAQFYEQQRPSPRGHLLHLLAAVAGVAAVVLGAGPALSRQEGALLIVERLAAGEPLPAIDPVNAAWGVVFAVGVVVAAVGVDRLLVGGYREFQYRRVAGDGARG